MSFRQCKYREGRYGVLVTSMRRSLPGGERLFSATGLSNFGLATYDSKVTGVDLRPR